MAETNSIVATDNNSSMIANDYGDDNAIEEKKSGFAAALGNADTLTSNNLSCGVIDLFSYFCICYYFSE